MSEESEIKIVKVQHIVCQCEECIDKREHKIKICPICNEEISCRKWLYVDCMCRKCSGRIRYQQRKIEGKAWQKCKICEREFTKRYLDRHDGYCGYCKGSIRQTLFEESQKEQSVVPIDADLIYSMRLRGQYTEAKEMVKVFRKSVEKEKHQILTETFRDDRKKRKILGKCSNVFCKNNRVKGYSQCRRCINTRNKCYPNSKMYRAGQIKQFFQRVFS